VLRSLVGACTLLLVSAGRTIKNQCVTRTGRAHQAKQPGLAGSFRDKWLRKGILWTRMSLVKFRLDKIATLFEILEVRASMKFALINVLLSRSCTTAQAFRKKDHTDARAGQ
jgi:hypothetical protein